MTNDDDIWALALGRIDARWRDQTDRREYASDAQYAYDRDLTEAIDGGDPDWGAVAISYAYIAERVGRDLTNTEIGRLRSALGLDKARTTEPSSAISTWARTRGLAEFDTKRAANTTYDDMLFFERQAFLNLADAGTTTTTATDTSRLERATDREQTPHGDTHLETMKQTASPPEQTRLDDYADGRRPSDWKRIRDEVLTPFPRGVEIILDEVKAQDGIREPVIAAIDTKPCRRTTRLSRSTGANGILGRTTRRWSMA